MLIISLCNMLMISCIRPRGKETEAHKTQMSQRCPRLFKMKTELIKEAKSTRRGIRALWGIRMTHNQPSKTHRHTQSRCLCVWIFKEQIFAGMAAETKDGSSSCWQFRTVLNIDTSHISNSELLEDVQVVWACLNKQFKEVKLLFLWWSWGMP